MSWAKFDDRYDDNEKVKRAWKQSPAAAALHAHAITYSARHETDGVVTVEWVQERFDIARLKDRDRKIAVDALVTNGLFTPIEGDRFVIKDYLKFNPSRDQMDAKRRRDSARKRKDTPKGVHPDSTRSPNGFHADSTRIPDGVATDSSGTPSGPHARPQASPAARPVPSRDTRDQRD